MGTKMVRVSGWAETAWRARLAHVTRVKRSARLSLRSVRSGTGARLSDSLIGHLGMYLGYNVRQHSF